MINRLYNESIYLYEILKHIEIIKNNIEYKKNNSKTESEIEKYKKELTNIYRIRNNTFVLLMKNGHKCTRNDDSIIMQINNDEFICNEKAIKTILQKEYDEIIKKVIKNNNINKNEGRLDKKNEEKIFKEKSEMIEDVIIKENDDDAEKIKETNLKNNVIEKPQNIGFDDWQDVNDNNQEIELENKISAEIVEEKISENDTNNEIDNNEKELIDEPEMIQENSDNEQDSLEEKISNIKDSFYGKKEEKFEKKEFENHNGSLLSISYDSLDDFKDLKFNKLNNPEEDDLAKRYDEIIMDIYKIKVKDFKKNVENLKKRDMTETEEETREIELSIVPLTVPEDGNSISSDILVIIKDDQGSGYFTSNIEGRKSVIASNSTHSFIVTGSWENGLFKTDVRPTGKTLIEKREVSREVRYLRPLDIEKAKLGHPLIILNEEYINGDIKTLRIHSIPLSIRSKKTDLAPTIYCMDNIEENKRIIYSAKSKPNILFEFEDDLYKVTSIWDGEYFESEITSVDR